MRGQPSRDASFLVHWCIFAALQLKKKIKKILCKLFISRLILESDSLTITEVMDGDAGVYTCITNTTLDQDSASAELTVVGRFSSPEVCCDSLRASQQSSSQPFKADFRSLYFMSAA